ALDPDVERARRGGAGTLALRGHQPRERLVVDAEAALAGELLRELDREAVRVVEPEGVLAGDLGAGRDLLEEAEAAGERLRGALLLGREDPMDVAAVLRQPGVRVAHLLDHDLGEAVEAWPLEPAPARLL